MDDKSTFSKIRKDMRLVSGVYAFVHNKSYKVYVGSAFNLALAATSGSRLNFFLLFLRARAL